MQKYATKILVFMLIGMFSTLSLSGQKKWMKAPVKTDPVVCFASGESGHAFVRPPEGFINRLKSGIKTSNLVAQYVNVPDSVKPAIEYALEIWEYLISSSIPVYIRISWEVLDKNNLGSCGATDYYQNFDGAPLKNTFYPVAAVEKITGKEVSGPGNPDMTARFNSTISWYIGTDGKTPVTKYDLVTIVLHEITHGLGFNGFFTVNTTQRTAKYGIGDEIPSAYDRFVENFQRNRLTNPVVFNNNSYDLYREIVSDQLYSGGQVTLDWNGNERARLYAPRTYSVGSSIYHLNDQTYPFGNMNALMTSAAGQGEAVHSPGPLASGMIADFGWKHMYIDFQPLKDREDPSDSIDFNTVIKSDLGIMENSVSLIYSGDAFKQQRDTLLFKPVNPEGGFTARLKSGISNGKYTYYISARDTAGRKFTDPYNYPDSVFVFSVGTDTEKPVISHLPLKYLLSSVKSFEIRASVTDNLGVDSVFVIFYRNGAAFNRSQLARKGGDIYSGSFTIKSLNLENVDSVRYSIFATDLSRAKNSRLLPEKGTFAFRLENTGLPVTVYSNNFESRQADFILSDFSIRTEFGFDNNALHSPHPYPSPERDNDSLEFISVLRIPVILLPKGRMSFDEVVLVEPGEEGAVFGEIDFYDYVIVEGSKDGGIQWFPLINGYDSGNQELWQTAYYDRISGNNSTTAGAKSMFIPRQIDLTGNGRFNAGDTLLIRFRLHSDPYAHGWGWAIDNLNIQENLVSVKAPAISSDQFLIWPNPVSSVLFLKNNMQETIRQLDVEIMDITGRILFRKVRQNVFSGQVISLDVNNIPSGVFFIRIHSGKGYIFTRRIIKPT